MSNYSRLSSVQHSMFFVLFSVFFFFSCNYFKKTEEEKKIARVFNEYLYESQLRKAIPFDVSAEDSARLAETYINNWIKQRLILSKAELNLTEEKKNVEKQLEDYRISLLIYLYQDELVKQRLDTNIRQSDMEKYYEENKQNFELKENILRAVYVKLDRQNKSVNKIRKWLNDGDTESKKRLKEYCGTQALRYSLDEQQWQTPEELAKETGIEQRNIENMARYPNTYELYENDGYYIIKTIEYKLKNEISPLSFNERKIRNIILNKRKLQLMEKMEKDVITEAAAKNNFEIYSPK